MTQSCPLFNRLGDIKVERERAERRRGELRRPNQALSPPRCTHALSDTTQNHVQGLSQPMTQRPWLSSSCGEGNGSSER